MDGHFPEAVLHESAIREGAGRMGAGALSVSLGTIALPGLPTLRGFFLSPAGYSMSTTYSELLAQLAQAIGVDSSSLLAQQVLRIGTLDIFLQPGGTREAPELLLCSVLGSPPEQRFGEVLHTLMQANHQWVGTRGGVLGLSPAGDAISWSARMPARDLDGASLAAWIADFSALGQAWMQYLTADADDAKKSTAFSLNAGARA